MKMMSPTLRIPGLVALGALWLAVCPACSCPGGEPAPIASNPAAAQGRTLYLMNCAHCHGVDATGDEGPDLHDLNLSDDRMAKLINNGKKGEMPKFSPKLEPAQVQLLIAYLHTLK